MSTWKHLPVLSGRVHVRTCGLCMCVSMGEYACVRLHALEGTGGEGVG